MRPNRWASMLPPMVWATFSIFYLVQLSDVLSQPFHALVRGIGAVQYLSKMVWFSPSADHAVFMGTAVALVLIHLALFRKERFSDPLPLLASVGFALSLLGVTIGTQMLFILFLGLTSAVVIAFDARKLSDFTGRSAGGIMGWFSATSVGIFAALSAASSLRWIVNGFEGSVPISDASWHFAFVALQLLGFLHPILPELAIIFLFSWALRLITPRYLHLPCAWRNGMPNGQVALPPLPTSRWSNRVWSLTLLATAATISVFVGVYSYLPAVNPGLVQVGVDVRYCYSHLLNGLPMDAICGATTSDYGNQRMGANMLLKALASLGAPDNIVFMLAQAILSIFLTVSTYALVLEGTGDGFTAGVSSLFAATSAEIIAGVNAGMLANWLALSVAFLFLASLLHAMKTKRGLYILSTYALFVVLLFAHPWTWTLLMVIVAIFFSFLLGQSALSRSLRSKNVEALLLGSLLAVGLVAERLRSLFLFGNGLALAYSFFVPWVDLSNVPRVAPNLERAFAVYLLGATANPMWYVLGAVGVIAIPSLRGNFGRLLFAWLVAISFAIVLVGWPSDTLQARLVVDVPLQMFAAIGLVSLLNLILGHLRDKNESRTRLEGIVVALTLVAVVGLMLGFALDNVGYLYRGVPGA